MNSSVKGSVSQCDHGVDVRLVAVAVLLAVATAGQHSSITTMPSRNRRLAAEGRADVLGGEDLGRRAVGDQPAVQQRHVARSAARPVSMSCVLTSTVMPRPRRRVEQRRAAPPWRPTSTPVKGSSSSSTCGSWASARARNTRCCWPPESSPIGARRQVGDRRARPGSAPRPRGRRPAGRRSQPSRP